MEGRSGFKECPRCGLRNRRFALRCDFCGFEFRDSKEEWTDYLDILERLGKTEDADVLDERVTKRIEATIVQATKKTPSTPPPEHVELEDPSTKELNEVEGPALEEGVGTQEDPSEKLRELITSMMEEGEEAFEEGAELEAAEPPMVLESGSTDLESAEGEPAEEAPERAHHDVPVTVEREEFPQAETGVEVHEEPMVEIPEVTGMEAAEEPMVEVSEITEVEAVREAPEGASAGELGLLSRVSHIGFRVFLACFVGGIAIYLAIIASGILVDISSAIGWTVALIAALLIVLGFGRLFETCVPRPPSRKRA